MEQQASTWFFIEPIDGSTEIVDRIKIEPDSHFKDFLGVMTLSITTLSITTFSITTISIMAFSMTIN